MSQAQASMAISRAQRIDPTWRPGPGISAATIEGTIARNQAMAREAEAHLSTLGRFPLQRELTGLFKPGGRLFGEQPGGAREVRNAPFSQFRELLNELSISAEAVATPARYQGQWYRRFDGAVIGARFSDRLGVTIYAIGSIPSVPVGFKVHIK